MRSPMAVVARGTLALILVASLYASAVSILPYNPEISMEAVAATPIKSINSGSWSASKTWEGGKVPSSGDDVIISAGTVVTYDISSTEEIGNIEVDGVFTFSTRKSTNLDVANIMVSASGIFEMGTQVNPIPRPQTATLRFVVTEPGNQGLVMVGRGDIHGAPIKNTFTKLSRDVDKGVTELSVKDEVQDWEPGSTIVITTTGKGRKGGHSCTELNSVSAVSGKTITLKNPLRCSHDGTEPAQADVGLLTRNVVITSKPPNQNSVNDEEREELDLQFRGHTMFMQCGHKGEDRCTGGGGSISYAEFVKLGPLNKLGRYPIHFHQIRDTGYTMSIVGNSIWNSANRCITVHSTNGVLLKDNVAYNSVGHCYFQEDGDEVDNVWDHNLGILNHPGKLISSDNYPAIFWQENPLNTWTNNVAAQGYRYGFFFDVPNRVMNIKYIGEVHLKLLPIHKFDNNEAHNNGNYGLRTRAGFNPAESDEIVQEHPDLSDLVLRPSNINNFLSWRNGYWGIFLDGGNTEVSDSFFFGNFNKGNIGFGGNGNIVTNSHAMGEVADDRRFGHAGVVFAGGQNNIVKDSILERHSFIEEGELGFSADVRVGTEHCCHEISGTIMNTKLLSPRTIIFEIPQHPNSHLTVQNYIAPNDPHANQVPKDFSLWRIDKQVDGGVVDTHFIAVVVPISAPPYQPEPISISAATDSAEYEIGDTVTITISVDPAGLERPVGIQIFNPDQNAFRFDQVRLDKSGSYTYDFKLLGNLAKSGAYRIEITYFDAKQILFIDASEPTIIATNRLSISDADIVDTLGSTVSSISVDQQVRVKGGINNNQDTGQAYSYIVQIKDSKDIVVSLSWISGFINAKQSISTEQSWLPYSPGSYRLQIFIWQSIDNPVPLSSDVPELTIKVS
ncbi:MAG: G8 domain-containing protein [Nitrososphaerales archaeon]